MAGSPRIIAHGPTRSPTACRRAHVRQGQAFGGAEEALVLDRRCVRRRWKYAVGTKECSAARVEQKNRMTKDDKNGVTLLDKESPI
jgi:hypothetical protein